ncbi:MAG: cupin domain-containing protein [Thermomicrobiales bacterium]
MIEDAEAVIELLGLRPLEIEGGWFRETYQTRETVETAGGPRPLATAIFYLLTANTCSEMHRLPGDEVFHFYLGDPVQMLHLSDDAGVERPVMGPDVYVGQRVQLVVPGGTWQGARLQDGGRFALLGTMMSPGFSYDDYVRGDREALVRQYPVAASEIETLTRTSGHAPR